LYPTIPPHLNSLRLNHVYSARNLHVALKLYGAVSDNKWLDRIYNHFYPIAVDLNKGSALDSMFNLPCHTLPSLDPFRSFDTDTAITAWQDNRGMNQAWYIQLAAGKDIFTVRNVRGGSYMDLKGSMYSVHLFSYPYTLRYLRFFQRRDGDYWISLQCAAESRMGDPRDTWRLV
jgi:hypothetical protein